ncbi:hypothetical protein NKH77_02110 [Streptomyces sp. M19]
MPGDRLRLRLDYSTDLFDAEGPGACWTASARCSAGSPRTRGRRWADSACCCPTNGRPRCPPRRSPTRRAAHAVRGPGAPTADGTGPHLRGHHRVVRGVERAGEPSRAAAAGARGRAGAPGGPGAGAVRGPGGRGAGRAEVGGRLRAAGPGAPRGAGAAGAGRRRSGARRDGRAAGRPPSAARAGRQRPGRRVPGR